MMLVLALVLATAGPALAEGAGHCSIGDERRCELSFEACCCGSFLPAPAPLRGARLALPAGPAVRPVPDFAPPPLPAPAPRTSCHGLRALRLFALFSSLLI